MKVAIFVHDPQGDMGDATVIGPFSSWERAERFRDAKYPWDGPLEAILVPLVGPRDHNHHPTNSSPQEA